MTTNTNIEAATKTLNDMKDARDLLVGRSAKIVADRQAISYAAHLATKRRKKNCAS
jgi:hypothetical protein